MLSVQLTFFIIKLNYFVVNVFHEVVPNCGPVLPQRSMSFNKIDTSPSL